MPSSKSLIKSYREADISSGTCAAYSPLNHFAYCGNRKGEVNIYDVRTHKKLQKFVASDSSVKALALDSEEYYIATGSSEGNVKVGFELVVNKVKQAILDKQFWKQFWFLI